MANLPNLANSFRKIWNGYSLIGMYDFPGTPYLIGIEDIFFYVY